MSFYNKSGVCSKCKKGSLSEHYKADKHEKEIRSCKCGCGNVFEVLKSSKRAYYSWKHEKKVGVDYVNWNTGLTKENSRVLKNIKRDKLKQELFKKYGYIVTYVWEHDVYNGKFKQILGGLKNEAYSN